MADVTALHPTHNAEGKQSGAVLIKLVDNGDGTYSQAVSPTSTGASSGQVQGAAAGNAAAVGNPVQAGGIYESTPSTYDNNDAVPLHTDSRGSLRVTLIGTDATSGPVVTNGSADAIATSANGITVNARQQIYNGASMDRVTKATSTARLLSSAATTNATSVKASAGNLFKITCENTVASKRYLKFYNKASAPVVGTDTPIWTEVIPASATSYELDFGAQPLYFSAGIAYAITGAAADNDTTALGAGDIQCLNIAYS